MNEATAKRWIEGMACSEEQKATALQDIKGKSESEIKLIVTRLRNKSGAFKMHKRQPQLSWK